MESNCIAKTNTNCHNTLIKLIFHHQADEDITHFTGTNIKKLLKDKDPYNKFIDANAPVS